MLDIINRIGIVCYSFCYIAGFILVVLGILVHTTSDGPAYYVFYYIFAATLFSIGFLVKYIFYGRPNDSQ